MFTNCWYSNITYLSRAHRHVLVLPEFDFNLSLSLSLDQCKLLLQGGSRAFFMQKQRLFVRPWKICDFSLSYHTHARGARATPSSKLCKRSSLRWGIRHTEPPALESWVTQDGSDSHRHPQNVWAESGQTSQLLSIHRGLLGKRGVWWQWLHADLAGRAFWSGMPYYGSAYFSWLQWSHILILLVRHPRGSGDSETYRIPSLLMRHL